MATNKRVDDAFDLTGLIIIIINIIIIIIIIIIMIHSYITTNTTW